MNEDARTYPVPADLYWSTRLVKASEGLWQRLGQLESWALREEIETHAIEQPLYVTALARSGTTIVTEMLNEHPDLTSHRYADFPWVHTPFWRNWLRQRLPAAGGPPVERAHKDRILVTQDSPEAVEEVLWMRFFPDLHRIGADQRLGPEHRHAGFDDYYRDHIRKLLIVRGAKRYLAKGNYNVSRVRYLLDLFPDARFVVPIRRPLDHIASLAKQHRYFLRAAEANPRTRFQLGASGHFEFGADRMAIELADQTCMEAIRSCWREGREARGWGLYWAAVYDYLKDLTEQDDSLRRAIHFVRYEDLCADPGDTVDAIVAHCRLDPAPFAAVRATYLERLAPPAYYQPDFSESERAEIEETTAGTAARFGY